MLENESDTMGGDVHFLGGIWGKLDGIFFDFPAESSVLDHQKNCKMKNC